MRAFRSCLSLTVCSSCTFSSFRKFKLDISCIFTPSSWRSSIPPCLSKLFRNGVYDISSLYCCSYRERSSFSELICPRIAYFSVTLSSSSFLLSFISRFFSLLNFYSYRDTIVLRWVSFLAYWERAWSSRAIFSSLLNSSSSNLVSFSIDSSI